MERPRQRISLPLLTSLEEIALRLLKLVLKEKVATGPEQIGVDPNNWKKGRRFLSSDGPERRSRGRFNRNDRNDRGDRGKQKTFSNSRSSRRKSY